MRMMYRSGDFSHLVIGRHRVNIINACVCYGESYNVSTHASNCVKRCRHPKRLRCGGKNSLSVYMSTNKINENENESENERKENDASTNDSREGSADDNLDGSADDNLDGTAHDGTQARDRKLHVDVIFKYNETGAGGSYKRKYGYVQDDHGSYILKFTDDNMQKKALCEKESLFHNKGNNRENKQTTDTNDLNTPENNDSSVPALVSVGVLVAIAVAVVTVTFVYRRYRFSHRFNKMPEIKRRITTPDYNYPDFTYEMSSNISNQSALNNVEYNYPDFSMLNDSEPTKNDDAKAFQNQEIGPVDTETHVYSTAENENEYNTASKRPDVLPNETYDHADPMTKGGSNTSGDTTYDVSMSTDAQLQKFDGLTDNVYNTENETYNRLGSDKPEVKKSDHVYGSNQIETYKRVPNIGDDVDGPYNSTSEKFENCGITDNPYSELGAH